MRAHVSRSVPEPGPRWHQALAMVKELPIGALSQLAILLGGLVLLAFFVRVGFMPEVSLESVVSLLYAVALLGLGLMGLMASGLVLPAVLLRHAIPWPQHRMTGGAFLLCTALAAILWFTIFAAWLFFTDTFQPWMSKGLAVLLILALVVWAVPFLFLAEGAWRERPSMLYGVVTAQQFAVQSIPILIVVTLLAGGDLAHADKLPVLGIFGLLLAVHAVLTSAQALLMDRSGWGQSLVLALALLLLMVVATGSAGSILDAVMGRLQWGKVQPVRAVLTHAGCEQLNLATGQGICSMPAGADTPAVICPLELRSRIGTQVLLASASPASAASDALQQPGWQVPLERKELLAWSKVSQGCDAKMR